MLDQTSHQCFVLDQFETEINDLSNQSSSENYRDVTCNLKCLGRGRKPPSIFEIKLPKVVVQVSVHLHVAAIPAAAANINPLVLNFSLLGKLFTIWQVLISVSFLFQC